MVNAFRRARVPPGLFRLRQGLRSGLTLMYQLVSDQ